MNRQPPRKGRHQHNGSASGRRGHGGPDGLLSGTEPDDEMGGSQAGAGAGVTEALMDMNLAVLQKYEPSVQSILSVAASTTVYVLNYATGAWEKPEPPVEGTLFLCEQEPLRAGAVELPRACVFVLNRKGLANVVVDLARVSVAEVTDDLVTLRVGGYAPGPADAAYDAAYDADAADSPVLGFWIHGGTSTVMQLRPAVVLECWQAVRAALEHALGTADTAATAPVLDAAEQAAFVEMQVAGRDPVGKATHAVGRRPHIHELVATAQGGHREG